MEEAGAVGVRTRNPAASSAVLILRAGSRTGQTPRLLVASRHPQPHLTRFTIVGKDEVIPVLY
jgi:hypothetical protein